MRKYKKNFILKKNKNFRNFQTLHKWISMGKELACTNLEKELRKNKNKNNGSITSVEYKRKRK